MESVVASHKSWDVGVAIRVRNYTIGIADRIKSFEWLKLEPIPLLIVKITNMK